ncbi:MAG: phosphonate ABC transporter, permease protein PhnE [Anaerolineae bacterium]|nr:phosphonate ABC transporter, permease protein PhnE [Anaerolineae bacterium]
MTTAAQAREQTQSPQPRQPIGRSPLLAALLALIPGVGHFYVNQRLRGIILLLLLPLMVFLTLWRLEVSGVNLGALLNGTQSTADFTSNATAHFSMTIVLFVMLVLIYLWSIWDAYSGAGGRMLSPRLPFFMLFLVAFIIGWDVTQINLYKAITEIGDIVPRLSQLAWPWDQALVAGEFNIESTAQWATPCTSDAPNPPEEIEGQPYIRIEPTCGDISGPAQLDGSRTLGTEITVVGRGFKPGEPATLWWRPQSIPEFRPRANGTPIVLTPDEEGAFRFTFNAPNFTIPSVAVGTISSTVIVRQVESEGNLRPSSDLLLALSLMVETIYLGLMATFFGTVLAIPLSFIAARNLMSENVIMRGIYFVTRTLLNVIRSIEPLIWAIIAAAWVGLGPFAGMIALTLHSIASLGKLYSEAIESIEEGPIEALQATGASRLQVIVYAVLPQVIPPFVSFTVYRWDINVRMSTIIGAVGGGGIGFILIQWIRLGNFDSAGIAVWLIAITVSVLDYISSQLREAYV